MRLELFTSKKYRRRGFGWPVVTYRSPDQLGLIIYRMAVVILVCRVPGSPGRGLR
jgi:hypothetical protein